MPWRQLRSFNSCAVLAPGLAVAAVPVAAASTTSVAKVVYAFTSGTITRDCQCQAEVASDAQGDLVVTWMDQEAGGRLG